MKLNLEEYYKYNNSVFNINEKHIDKFIGYFNYEKDININRSLKSQKIQIKNNLSDLLGEVIIGLLSKNDINKLNKIYQDNPKRKMSNNAIKESYGYSENGILRSCFFNMKLADRLTKLILNHINPFKENNGDKFVLRKVNPLFRFIEYSKGQSLVPHYDVPVIINEDIYSLSTIVLYLTNNNYGHTRFLNDFGKGKENEFKDIIDNRKLPIIGAVKPTIGSCLIFDHYVLHDSEEIKENNNKIIITTEIFYERIK